ncbi:MAG: ABC transporter substrate-binding protein, partial [Acidimicrobiia bacterium]
MRRTLTMTLAGLSAVLAACASTQSDTPESLTLIAHDSFAGSVTDETFNVFTEDTGIDVEVLAAGDAGSLVNQAVLSTDNPLADVLFGVDDTFLSRALEEGIFTEYESANLDSVIEAIRETDPHVTPIDYGDVCFNYDKAWFEDNEV